MALALQNQCMLVFLLIQCNLGLNLKDVQGCSRKPVASTSIHCPYGLLHHLQYSRNVNNGIIKVTEVCLPEQAASPWDDIGIYHKISAELKNSGVFNSLCSSAGKKTTWQTWALENKNLLWSPKSALRNYKPLFLLSPLRHSFISGLRRGTTVLRRWQLYCWQPSGHSAAAERWMWLSLWEQRTCVGISWDKPHKSIHKNQDAWQEGEALL